MITIYGRITTVDGAVWESDTEDVDVENANEAERLLHEAITLGTHGAGRPIDRGVSIVIDGHRVLLNPAHIVSASIVRLDAD